MTEFSRREFLQDSARLAAGSVLAGSLLSPSLFAADMASGSVQK